MELCLINIANVKLSTIEVDIVHVLLEDVLDDWSVGELLDTFPHMSVSDVWSATQTLILESILERTDKSQSTEDIEAITLSVPRDARIWLAENAEDIRAAFVMLNPDIFDVTEVADA